MKFTPGKHKIGIGGLVLIIAAMLAVTPQALAFRFVVLADSPDNQTNQAGFNQNALEYLRDRILNLNPKPDMVFFLGDLVTKAHNLAGDRFLPQWQVVMSPLAQANIKVFVAVGNRDLYGAAGQTEKSLETEFQTYFSGPPFDMPANGPPSYKYLAYSISHENALFVVLDTFGFYRDGDNPDGSPKWVNWDNGLDAEQLGWFASQAGQATEKYKFVLSHGPAFSPEGWTVDPSVQQNLWDIMQDNHFDAYFCGHEHIYSRWKIDEALTPQPTPQITQIITGSAGALPDQIFKVKENRKKVHAASLYNYVVGDINGRSAHFKTYGIDLNAGKYSAKVIDRFTLAK